MKILYTSFLLLILAYYCAGFSGEPACSFTGGCIRDHGESPTDPCPDPKNSMTPYAQKGVPKLPLNSRKYLLEICPDLVDMDLCCNDDQILMMYNNFKTIDSLFGNCLICSLNLKRFWCQFTCSPYQYYFVDAGDQIHVPDVDDLCLNVTMRIGTNVACDLFDSCVKNPYVATLASGQSAIGFLEFMGTNAVQTGLTKINFGYSNDPELAMIEEMYPCDMDVNGTLDGYKVAPCTCNYCETACKPSNAKAYPGFFDGFDFAVVAIVYVALIVLSVIIYYVKRKIAGKSEDSEVYEESSSKDMVVNGSMDQSKLGLLSGVRQESSKSNESKARINKSSVYDD